VSVRSAVRRAWLRLRFAAWALALRGAIRRRGGRIVIDAPWGADLRAFPALDVAREGGGGSLHLRIGRDVTIGRGVRLRLDASGESVLALGDRAALQDGVRVWLLSGAVRVGAGAIVRDQAVLKSGGELVIGEDVRVGYATVIHCHERVELEDQAIVADLVVVVDSDHVHDGSETWVMRQPVRSTPILIRRNSLVGASSVIARGATVGANSVVAAGAVVRAGEHPAGWLIGGVPARPLHPLDEESPAEPS
jgi:maltose O-acetyltransferase